MDLACQENFSMKQTKAITENYNQLQHRVVKSSPLNTTALLKFQASLMKRWKDCKSQKVKEFTETKSLSSVGTFKHRFSAT